MKVPTWKRVRNKTPSSTRREGSAKEKVKNREGEDREHRLSPKGSTSEPRLRTLENQAQEWLKRSRSICFPPTPLKGSVAPKKLRRVIKESLPQVSSKDSGSSANRGNVRTRAKGGRRWGHDEETDDEGRKEVRSAKILTPFWQSASKLA